MVDLIIAGRSFELSFQFCSDIFARLPHIYRDLIGSSNPNIASYYESCEKSVLKGIERTIYKIFSEE